MPGCSACGDFFMSEKGLQQHLNRRVQCLQRMNNIEESNGEKEATAVASFRIDSKEDDNGVANKDTSPSKRLRVHGVFTRNLSKALQAMAKTTGLESDSSSEEDEDTLFMNHDDDEEDHETDSIAHESVAEAVDAQVLAPEQDPSNPDYNWDQVLSQEVNTTMNVSFRDYCADVRKNHMPHLLPDQISAIKLMNILVQKKTPLDAYQDIMHWHFVESNQIEEEQQLKDCDQYISRRKMIRDLTKRYNMQAKLPVIRPLILPHSKEKVNIVCHDAYGCIEALLTDPRLTDDDFWFFDNDPTAYPPAAAPIISDINTGRAYREAVKQYKKDPNDVVLPIIMYIDDTETGVMKNLPICALKLTLGIFTREYRDKDHGWRELGYVPSVTKNQSRARRFAMQSGHISSNNFEMADGEGDYEEGTPGDSDREAHKPGDYHAMIDKILESYRDLQQNGFQWDLRYRGKTWYGLTFIPFLLFIKCDTKEGDMLCGSFNTYNAGVKNLCRYCVCPTEDSDNPEARYEFKSVPMLKPLVDDGDEEALRQISQQMNQNAWWKIRFSPANNRGVHGSCPSEILHAVLLGIFLYLRNTFYDKVGKTSKYAKAMDTLSQLIGDHFGRQSERNMPKCKFTNGIRQGRLNAKEFVGILLVMAAVLHSTKGQNFFAEHADFNTQKVKDWAYLLELMIVWYSFMVSNSMHVRSVSRLSTRTRYIMWLIKKVANRTTGMGLKLMKFHALTHLGQDISMFGVPMNFDTGSDEKGHKPTKSAAKMTQKNQDTFTFQTAIRRTEFHMIDLAMQELEGKNLWDYHKRPETIAPNLMSVDDDAKKPTTGETKINIIIIQHTDIDDLPAYSLGVGHQSRKPATVPWDPDVITFLHQLQIKMNKWETRGLEIRSDHKRYGHIFRGHPNFRSSGPWRDWVVIDWGGPNGESRKLPAQIWCFVLLNHLPTSERKQHKHRKRLNHGECDLRNGVYAVVESTQYVGNPSKKYLLFRKVNLVMNGERRKFYLVDTEAFVEPCFMIPDHGSANRRAYFQIRNRDEWTFAFEEWLEQDFPPEYLSDKEGKNLHPE